MPILCESSANARNLIPSIGGQVRGADSLDMTVHLLERDPAETLVVIGTQVPTGDALEFAASLRLARPAVGVVLTRDHVTVELLTRALQAGVREIVPAGDYAALAAACRRSREISQQLLAATQPAGPAPVTNGEIITVFAAKGGCGKTTVATNLGVVLASGGQRRVCVLDLDLSFGDVAISVQLDAARTIIDALPMAGHLDSAGAAQLLTPYREGLDMLLAPVTPGDAEKVPPGLISELLRVLRTMYEYIVVDTPAQFSEHVLTALDASSHHVLIATPDVPALKNLRVTVDMFDLLSYPREIRSVVLNRADSKVGLGPADVERVVRCPIAAHVPSSRAVPVSINQGTPITLANPGHPVSQAISTFAQERLLRTTSQATASPLARIRRRAR